MRYLGNKLDHCGPFDWFYLTMTSSMEQTKVLNISLDYLSVLGESVKNESSGREC